MTVLADRNGHTQTWGPAVVPTAMLAVPTSPLALKEIAKGSHLDHDAQLRSWLALADQGRPHNAHDEEHARLVRRFCGYLAVKLGLTAQQKYRAIIAGHGHDAGSWVGHHNHEEVGGRMIADWMISKGATKQDADAVYVAIAAHRTSFVLETGIISPEHAVLVLADKGVGDRKRVRPIELREELETCHRERRIQDWLEVERREVLAGNANRLHIRVNTAIEPYPRLVVDTDLCEICLSLRLTTSIAPSSDLLGLFGERYQACVLAARYFGCRFRVAINDERFFFDASGEGWAPVGDCVADPTATSAD